VPWGFRRERVFTATIPIFAAKSAEMGLSAVWERLRDEGSAAAAGSRRGRRPAARPLTCNCDNFQENATEGDGCRSAAAAKPFHRL